MSEGVDRKTEGQDEDDALRELVKRAMASETVAKPTPDILRGVQRRLRQRSRGKFFADGWSTAQAREAYVMVAVGTILLVALAYFALSPMGFR